MEDVGNDELAQPWAGRQAAQAKKINGKVRCSQRGSAVLTTCVQHGKTDPMLARLNLSLKDQCNIGDFAVVLLESHGYIVGEDGSLAHPDFDYVLAAG